MFSSDIYYEFEPFWHAYGLKAIELQCKALTKQNMDVTPDFEYHGLITNFETLQVKLRELEERGYYLKSIRRHCNSGIIDSQSKCRYHIVGLSVQSEKGKGLQYIDYILFTEPAEDYIDNLPLPNELMKEFMEKLELSHNFSQRQEGSQVWYSNSIFKSRNQEQ